MIIARHHAVSETESFLPREADASAGVFHRAASRSAFLGRPLFTAYSAFALRPLYGFSFVYPRRSFHTHTHTHTAPTSAYFSPLEKRNVPGSEFLSASIYRAAQSVHDQRARAFAIASSFLPLVGLSSSRVQTCRNPCRRSLAPRLVPYSRRSNRQYFFHGNSITTKRDGDIRSFIQISTAPLVPSLHAPRYRIVSQTREKERERR